MRECYASEDCLVQAFLILDHGGPGRHLLSYVGARPEVRGTGAARAVMDQVAADLRSEGGTILLSVEPDGFTLDEERPEMRRLIRWYESLGYRLIPESRDTLGTTAMFLTYEEGVTAESLVAELTAPRNTEES